MLIKSTVNSLPIHWFGLFQAPKVVINAIEKIKMSFFSEEIKDDDLVRKRLHLLAWDVISLPKYLGGLCLSFSLICNIALLSK